MEERIINRFSEVEDFRCSCDVKHKLVNKALAELAIMNTCIEDNLVVPTIDEIVGVYKRAYDNVLII